MYNTLNNFKADISVNVEDYHEVKY